MKITGRFFINAVAGMILLFLLMTSDADGQLAETETAITRGPVVDNKIPEQFIPADVQSFHGMLNAHIMMNQEKRLLQVDSATMLAGFEHRPGEQTWIGEHAGKFLFSASNTYRYTHDPRLRALLDGVAKTYMSTQLPDGYLGTYLPKDYWTAWDVWAHKYAIIGLLNYYSVTGNEHALSAAKKAADLICSIFGDGTGMLELNKAGEHAGLAPGSILEPMVDLYRFTGDQKYLDFARYILRDFESATGPKIMTALQKYGVVTKVGDAKAYEMLSCFNGMLKYYELTGEKRYLQTLTAAWQDIVMKRLYITGTASSFEVFQDDHKLPAGNKDDMGEGCVTVTWIQFNERLLRITGDLKYAEEIEKSIYNHLFAAESPQTGCVSYYTPLQGAKPYKCDQNFSCCLSSVPGGISLIPGLVWGKIGKEFSILMYEAGEVQDAVQADDGSDVLLQIKATSDVPDGGNAVYTISPSAEKKFIISFRVPSWCTGYSLAVNNVKQKDQPGRLFKVHRLWKAGDRISVHFAIPLQTIAGGISYPGCIAFKRGPQVLALDSAWNHGGDRAMSTQLPENGVYTIEKAAAQAPVGWIGSQAYVIRRRGATKTSSFVFVPFADAGQLSGSFKVWVKQ